jgi:hypothetical protein
LLNSVAVCGRDTTAAVLGCRLPQREAVIDGVKWKPGPLTFLGICALRELVVHEIAKGYRS